MYRDIPVETSLARGAERFREDTESPAITVRGTYGPRDVEMLLELKSGEVPLSKLAQLAPYLPEDYEYAFSLKPRRANRIYGRPAGGHIDVRRNAPVMHLELSDGELPRKLYVAEAGDSVLRASRDDPKDFKLAKDVLGIEEETFEGELFFGDLTLMRRTLHEFRTIEANVEASALRLSQ